MNRWQIGQVRVTQVVEIGPVPTSPKFFFRDPPADLVSRHPWLKPHSADAQDRLLLSIHCSVIESAGRRIVVDTCVGNDKPRRHPDWSRLNGSFLQDLQAAGFAPDRIDTVLCAHLHVDPVGWNARWDGSRWVPTVSNARYLFARKEWEHWSQQSVEADADDRLGDSVRPILESGLADRVDTDLRLTDEVRLETSPGHTPGHVSVRIESEGQQAVISGDLMHHPIQCSEPDRSVNFDADRSLARGTHFAHPTAGRVVPDGEVWRFEVR